MARVSKYADKRDHVLTAIAESARSHSRPPTVRDLADSAQVGVATMHSYLTKLADEGLIQWQTARHRSVRVTQSGFQRLTSLGWPSA